jgi:lipopolysaccharide biosynthesis glycosyltransferase
MRPSIWIGFDPRETAAYAVCRESIRQWNNLFPVHGLVLDDLVERDLYCRPTERRLGKLYDTISATADYNGQMATEFAISRFLVPYLAKTGQALFMDCDMLVRGSLTPLFMEAMRQSNKAVLCVKHEHNPSNLEKMDGVAQTRYHRKNWSSVMLFNCDHPANKRLTLDLIHSVPGRDLHRFCWLEDDEIGELGPEWNYLVGHTKANVDPKIVHFTDGGPWFQGFDKVEYADEWKRVYRAWAA